MRYQVRLVGDSDLPDGVDYAFAKVDDRTYLFMKASVVRAPDGECRALTRSFTTWEAGQHAPVTCLRHLASA